MKKKLLCVVILAALTLGASANATYSKEHCAVECVNKGEEIHLDRSEKEHHCWCHKHK